MRKLSGAHADDARNFFTARVTLTFGLPEKVVKPGQKPGGNDSPPMKKIQFRVLVAAAVCSLSSCVGDPFYGYGGYMPGLAPVLDIAFAPPLFGGRYYGGGRPPSFGGPPRSASRLSTGSLRGVDFRSPDVRRAPDPTLMLLR